MRTYYFWRHFFINVHYNCSFPRVSLPIFSRTHTPIKIMRIRKRQHIKRQYTGFGGPRKDAACLDLNIKKAHIL
jgi:hypothetical protein